MKRIFKKVVTLTLVFSFVSNLFLTQSFAAQNNADDLKVELNNELYYDDLINKNKELKTKVEELESNNIRVDHNIKTIGDVDFIYYSNDDESITGLIQISDDFSSEIRVNSVNSNPESIEFIKENGNKMVVGKDENGQFNKVLYRTPEYRTSNKKKKKPSWCPYVVGLVGTAVGGLYTKIALLVGGPVAAVIVAGVSSVGWTYVSEQCD